MVYGRLSFFIREGVAFPMEWAHVAVWGAAGLYLVFYAFLLSSEVGAGVVAVVVTTGTGAGALGSAGVAVVGVVV